jgi:NADH-quinone oxidoreductase subunit L
VGGAIQIPGVDKGIERWLDPSFTDSRLAHLTVSDSSAWIGLIIGAAIAALGIAIAYAVWLRSPAIPARARERFAPLYTFLSMKWYFDEAIDAVVVRPGAWIGQFAMAVLERILVGGAITGGGLGVVRAGSAAVRRAQTGFVRYYAALMVLALSGVALYFLISSA